MLRQPRHGSLRHLARFQPVVVHAQQACTWLQLADRWQGEDRLQERGQLFLSGRRHQKIPEGAEASTLVRIADGIPFTEDLVEQSAFAAVPGCDPFPHRPVEIAKTLFELAKICQQRIRRV